MNAKEKQSRINSCLRLTADRFRHDKNSVRLNTHNDKIHELAKCSLAYDLISQGKEIYTEVRFNNKKIADILIPAEYVVYEVLFTETDAQCLSKTKDYPKELEIRMVRAMEILK